MLSYAESVDNLLLENKSKQPLLLRSEKGKERERRAMLWVTLRDTYTNSASDW